MPIYSGAQKIDELYVGGQKIAEGHVWDGTQWQQVYSAASIVPMGLVHTSDQGMVNGAWAQIVGNTANTSGFPDTVMASNGLVVSGSGPAIIRARGRYQQANTSNHRLEVRINGVSTGVVYLSGAGGQTAQFGGDQNVTLANGDVVTYWSWATSSTSNRRTMYGAMDKTGSYLEIVPA